MFRWLLVFSTCFIWGCAQPANAQYKVEQAFPNISFDRPVDLQDPRDGSNRLFVVEQGGIIRVFENNPVTATTDAFLDIQDRVNSSGNEEGLLGLAFHPDYRNNGFLFVNYTASNPRRTVISRFKVSAQNPNRADPASETLILSFSQPYSNHNGGQVSFGPDGYLYIATGDGGSGGDPQGNGQNIRVLLGKMLRIDVDHQEGDKPYAIPEDNPFKNADNGAREEIFAYGLRNPWRFSFDHVTGDLWAGDVGQDQWEEIDIIRKGKNYGWNTMEGKHCYPPGRNCDTTALALPVIEYSRALGISVTGGVVFRGSAPASLVGWYVYADFGSGRIWALRSDKNGTLENKEILKSGLNISSFGVDRNNNMYLCTFNGGNIYRIIEQSTDVSTPKGQQSGYRLDSGYPNPIFSATHSAATFHFAIPVRESIRFSVVDFLGRERIQTLLGVLEPGQHSVTLRLSALAPGLYYSILSGGSALLSRSFVVTQ